MECEVQHAAFGDALIVHDSHSYVQIILYILPIVTTDLSNFKGGLCLAVHLAKYPRQITIGSKIRSMISPVPHNHLVASIFVSLAFRILMVVYVSAYSGVVIFRLSLIVNSEVDHQLRFIQHALVSTAQRLIVILNELILARV